VHNIRSILIQAFVSIIIIFITAGVIAFGLFNHAASQYQTVLESLVNQSRIIGLTTTLINSYKNLTKNINDSQSQTNYDQTKSEIINGLTNKSNLPLTDAAKATFSGIDNIIRNIISDTDNGLKSVRNNDLSSTTSYYDAANNQLAFLKELASEHYAQSLNGISGLLPKIKTEADHSNIAGLVACILAFLGSLVYALVISRSITKPIVDLTHRAKQISSGNLNVIPKSDTNIFNSNNEIGILSSSFNFMVDRLQEKITALDKSEKDLEQQSADLKHMNDLMTGRELRMIELKSEIESLKKQIPQS
jgi:methyl-accepting chemotaxis protein